MQAIRLVTASATSGGVDIALPGASENTIARVVGISDSASFQQAQSAAVIFVADPGSARLAGLNAFGRLYDLTSAEKAVLQHLMSGLSPDEIARQLNISVTTVRTHLARLFAKTKTSGQVALVARVNRMCLPTI